MDGNNTPFLLRKPWTEKRLLKWLFVVATVVATIQYLQYYIFYNSSYPFPYLKNITASYGSFYTYYLFIPLIFAVARTVNAQLRNVPQKIAFHFVAAVLISAMHLMLIHFLGWLQVYQWDDTPFFTSYRFLLSKWLHFEVLIYGVMVLIWRGLDYIRWNQLIKKEEVAEPEKDESEFLTSIRVKDKQHIGFISTDEIRWIEAYDNYIKIRVNGRYYLVRKTLSSIELELDPTMFQRIHRSVIVAISEVESIKIDGSNYQVILKDETPLKLSRSYKAVVEALLAR